MRNKQKVQHERSKKGGAAHNALATSQSRGAGPKTTEASPLNTATELDDDLLSIDMMEEDEGHSKSPTSRSGNSADSLIELRKKLLKAKSHLNFLSECSSTGLTPSRLKVQVQRHTLLKYYTTVFKRTGVKS